MRAMRRIFAGLLALLMVLGAAPPGWAGSSSPPPPAAAPAPADPRGSGRCPGGHAAARQLPPRRRLLLAAGRRRLGPGRAQHAAGPGRRALRRRRRATWRSRSARAPSRGPPTAPSSASTTRSPTSSSSRVTSGYAALDLRELAPGHTVELDTPGAAFTMERAGYYHAEVGGGRDRVPDLPRRQRGHDPGRRRRDAGGRESAGRRSRAASRRASRPRRAPALTAWDRWNYQRMRLPRPARAARSKSRRASYGAEDARSARHLAHGRELRQRVGAARRGGGLVALLAPGRWIWDPRFGWTWLDDAPWGWAPYHYGRWSSSAATGRWAPGPVIVRPVYSPALVVFLGGPVVRGLGRPSTGRRSAGASR